MKNFLKSAADALDILSLLASAYAVFYVFGHMSDADNVGVGGSGYIMICLIGLVIAGIPYCLAGALHRIVVRLGL